MADEGRVVTDGPWLCRAFGESDRPMACIAKSRADVERFFIDEWMGDKESPELPEAMALVKKFRLHIHVRWRLMPQNEGDLDWIAETPYDGRDSRAINADLNRAICECVAKLQESTK